MARPAWILTLALALPTLGCPEPEPDPSQVCMAEIDGTSWETVEEFDCPPTVPNACTYRRSLIFDAGEYEWMPSDSYATGPYECTATEIIGYVEAGGDEAFRAMRSEDSLELTPTDGSPAISYQPAP